MAMTSLAGAQVGITRPEPGELAERLTALGAMVVHVPLIEIGEPADGGLALRGALARLEAFDWVVVTSAIGARRVGGAARRHPGLRLAAVGPATAAALEAEAGRPVDLVPVLAQAEGLLGEFPAAPARVLLAQADRARPVLADGLATAGHLVESVIAYRTVSRQPTAGEAARLRAVDAVVFASGSAVSGWIEGLGAATPPVVVAIGPVTADAARTRGLTVTDVAPSPDPATIVDLVARALTRVASSGRDPSPGALRLGNRHDSRPDG
jgi:uroporphyrinogen-III synthase